MSEQPPALGRGIFGYRRTAVNELISDRDVMLRQAEGRVRASETKVARLEAELAELQESNARLAEEVQQLRADLERGQESAGTEAEPAAQLTHRLVNEELATILQAAEESAARIVERASSVTQQQVAESERMWREAQAQVSRFAAWRDRVDPILEGAAAKIEEVRGRIEDVPEQIRQALAPLADSIASLDGDLTDVSATTSPPLLVAPSAADLDAEPSASDAEPSASDAKPPAPGVDVALLQEAPVGAPGDSEGGRETTETGTSDW
jgi:predicted nuclease with TOPRIM domain